MGPWKPQAQANKTPNTKRQQEQRPPVRRSKKYIYNCASSPMISVLTILYFQWAQQGKTSNKKYCIPRPGSNAGPENAKKWSGQVILLAETVSVLGADVAESLDYFRLDHLPDIWPVETTLYIYHHDKGTMYKEKDRIVDSFKE